MADSNGTTPKGLKRKRDFFDDEDFSDVIIKFGERQVFAHKVILARGSIWFDRALSGNFSEANKKVIELHDDDVGPDAVLAMLRHLYGSNYRDQNLKEGSAHTVGVHLSVFMLGDKYDISSLRDEAAARFKKFLAEERNIGDYYAETIYAIQKLLGPHAPQLADKSLTDSTREFVLAEHEDLFFDQTFRNLLAEGLMLQKELAVVFFKRLEDHF